MVNYDGFESDKLRSAGESPESLYEEALNLMKNAGNREAIGALVMFLAKYPHYALAHNDLGVLYYGEGEKEKALEHYEQAVRLERQNPVFQKNLADFYYVEAGRMGEALQIYVKLLETNPTDIETLFILGQICESMKKTDDARVFYNKVLALEPWNMDARERLDGLGRDGGRRTEDGGQRTEGGGWRTEDGNLKVSFHADERPVNSAEKMYQDAQALINSGRETEGKGALERLLNAYPDYGLAHNDLGVLFYNEGNKSEALHHYEKAAQVEPFNDTYQKNLADFYYVEAGRMGEALQIYVKLLEMNPTDIETLFILGQMCESMKKTDDARVFYNKVLALEPWNMDARERLDGLGRDGGRRTEGGGQRAEDRGWRTEDGGLRAEDGNLRVNFHADERPVESVESMYRDAQELIRINRKVDAVKALEKLVASWPEYAIAHNDLGALYLDVGDKEKTLHHYEKAAVLQPQNFAFQKNLADLYYVTLGRTEEALEIYLRALEVNPTDIETLLITGHIHVSLNNFADAKVFYNKALEIEPWNVDAREILEQLETEGRRAEDRGQRTEDGGLRAEDGGRRTEDGGDQGLQDGWMENVSDRFIFSLVLSSENSKRLIPGTDGDGDSSPISDRTEIVVSDEASEEDTRDAIERIQNQSSNIIYVRAGKGCPRDAVDGLKFVAKRVNDNSNAADIKRELSELSSSGTVPVSDPEMADRFISLLERLADALRELTKPFPAPSLAREESDAREKVQVEKGLDVRNGDYKETILNRIVKMKNDKGMGWKDIAEALNSEGLPTISGKGKWHRKTIYRMYQKTAGRKK